MPSTVDFPKLLLVKFRSTVAEKGTPVGVCLVKSEQWWWWSIPNTRMSGCHRSIHWVLDPQFGSIWLVKSPFWLVKSVKSCWTPVLHHPSPPSSCSVPLQSWLHSARPEGGPSSSVKASILSLFQVGLIGFNLFIAIQYVSTCFNHSNVGLKQWSNHVLVSTIVAMNSRFNCLEYENANWESMDVYGCLWIFMGTYGYPRIGVRSKDSLQLAKTRSLEDPRSGTRVTSPA